MNAKCTIQQTIKKPPSRNLESCSEDIGICIKLPKLLFICGYNSMKVNIT